MAAVLHYVTSLDRRSILRRGLTNQLVCVVISLPFWLLAYRQRDYWIVLLYTLVIGNCIWILIDGGRHLASHLLTPRGQPRRAWPGWPAMLLIVVLGSIAGYSLGASIVDALLGTYTPSVFTNRGGGAVTVLVGALATYFYYSRERLHEEMAAAEAARRLAIETQLKLLESQLEPHMLFNTLANLRVLIEVDPRQAQAMLDRLIAFLRATLAASRSSAHTLGAEVERVADYLALMAVRMGPRLAVHVELPDPLRGRRVPPLLLQPLVENAIKHGLEPKVEGGRIEITAREDAGTLLLSVRDTGVGLGAAPPGEGTRFGLAQVRERLAALYGARAALELRAADDAGGGTIATIRLPADAVPAG